MKSPSEVRIDVGTGAGTTALVYHSERDAGAAIILGHGAGAGQQNAFMVAFARALAARGFDAITFNFLYTEQHRRIPDRRRVLQACYRAVIDAAQRDLDSARRSLFIGGKSMGGRIATHVAADDPALPLAGLVLLGYPLHPPDRPDERRDAHLPAVGRPMLFIQGSRDAFGRPEELESILPRLSDATLRVVEKGDHSFKLPGRNPAAQVALYADIQRGIADWVMGIMRGTARHSSPTGAP